MTNHSARFWDKMAPRYAKSPVRNEASYQQKLQFSREQFRPDSVLLEFGCGTGSTAITHAPFVKHIDAIDFSAKMIEIAKGKAAAQGISNITFAVAAIEEFPASDSAYDIILGLSILHLLENKQAVLAKVHRLLKPGGKFISSTACAGGLPWYWKFLLSTVLKLRLGPSHIDMFTRQELEASIVSAGFVIEKVWQPSAKEAVFIIASRS